MRFDRLSLLVCLAALVTPTLADVVPPARVTGLLVAESGSDIQLDWDPVTLDAAGQPETIDHYKMYRGTAPDFVPDKSGGTNLIGTSPTPSFTDAGVANDGIDYYYLATAVDAGGNEGNSKDSLLTTPVLDGNYTNTGIDVSWTDSTPGAQLLFYRLYWGTETGAYTDTMDVGLATAHSFSDLQQFINYYIVVVGVDVNGNETALSNEHIDVVRGILKMRVHDGEELCWGNDCSPNPGSIHRAGGWQVLTPVHWPEGDWTSIEVTFTMEARLCIPPNQGTTSKCGTGNPCTSPPCNGGYNPCGDPWDRLGHLFVVMDDCVENGGSCITNNNLELMRVVTPFGTDAEPPNGTGVVPPRSLTLDITPYAPLLVGDTHLGAHIGHFVQKGHWVTTDFTFIKRPELASPKPPADGIEILSFSNAPIPTREVTVPAEATDVKIRLFTTGHGGGLGCSGGSNDGNPCSSSADCPGGVCNPCDEFCQRTNRIWRDGGVVWSVIPWRTDCNSPIQCFNFNACGYPSCTFPRSGWCPGYIACHHNAPCDNDLDMTTEFPPGGTYDVDYDITPQNGSWPISMVMYWYE
jgi:hypothetical protein